MDSKRLGEILIESNGFKDLKEPAILTSGELGIYFVNAEKIVGDNNEWEKFGDDAPSMLAHLDRMVRTNPLFSEATKILAKEADQNLRSSAVVSGGQRRDWIFSGPIAAHLSVHHFALYKDQQRIVVTSGRGETYSNPPSLRDRQVVHAVDMITEGSSIYRVEDGVEKGWVPMIRENRGKVEKVIAVVSRLQGGEKRLAEQGVRTHVGIEINGDFLAAHSTQRETALRYFSHPKTWSEEYIRNEGIGALIGTFNPGGDKLERARKFLGRYEVTLNDTGRMEELRTAVRSRFGTALPAPIYLGEKQ